MATVDVWIRADSDGKLYETADKGPTLSDPPPGYHPAPHFDVSAAVGGSIAEDLDEAGCSLYTFQVYTTLEQAQRGLGPDGRLFHGTIDNTYGGGYLLYGHRTADDGNPIPDTGGYAAAKADIIEEVT